MQPKMEETEAAVHDLRRGVHDVISALDILKLICSTPISPRTFSRAACAR